MHGCKCRRLKWERKACVGMNCNGWRRVNKNERGSRDTVGTENEDKNNMSTSAVTAHTQKTGDDTELYNYSHSYMSSRGYECSYTSPK